jgi:glycosyltransferase involved in cell wall biosynthesis
VKILFINQSDIDGGAARAAHRLSSQLIEMGVDVKMQVMRKLGHDNWVLGPQTIFDFFISRLLPRFELLAEQMIGINPEFPWSLNLFNNPLLDNNFINSFDVIHLHWVGKNMLPLNKLRDFKIPIVWTLHDSWAFTGGCHYPIECRLFENSCGYCPQLSKNSQANDISKQIWLKKNTAYSDAHFHFVAPSRWIADEARASSLLKDFPISVIPNGLDTSIFSPQDMLASRKALGIPLDKKIILFGAISADTDKRKGMDLLIDTLNIMKKDNEELARKSLIVIFGTDNQALSKLFPLPVICLGMVKDVKRLAQIYSAADLTVVPSRSESFGQVASESLSCGTPVAAFNTSGLKDIITHLETGYLAEDFKVDDLANGIRLIIEDSNISGSMSVAARQRAIELFDIKVTSQKYFNLFQDLLVV